MPEPFRLILNMQLEMVRQYLMFSKRILDLWSGQQKSPAPQPAAVVVPMRKLKRSGCIGPADLRG